MWGAFCGVILYFSWIGTQAGMWFFGGKMVIRGELTLEFLITFNGLFMQLLMALIGISSVRCSCLDRSLHSKMLLGFTILPRFKARPHV
jgi:hypothetical protein